MVIYKRKETNDPICLLSLVIYKAEIILTKNCISFTPTPNENTHAKPHNIKYNLRYFFNKLAILAINKASGIKATMDTPFEIISL